MGLTITSVLQDAGELPANQALEKLPAALAMAAKEYGQGGVVLMVVQPGERNAYDQQATIPPPTQGLSPPHPAFPDCSPSLLLSPFPPAHPRASQCLHSSRQHPSPRVPCSPIRCPALRA